MKKKLVFVIESLQLGGSEKSLVTLLNQLDPAQFAIDLLVFHKGGLFEKQVPSTVNILYREFPMLNFLERLKYKALRTLKDGEMHSQQMLWPLIKNKFEKENAVYDVAIAYSQGFATYFTANYVNAPIKYSWLNVDYEQAKYQYKLDAGAYSKFKAIICVSTQVEKVITKAMKSYGKDVPTVLLPDIVDEKVIRKLAEEPLDFPKTKSRFQLVTVGRLKEEKGLLMAVEACAILREKRYDFTWSVIGEGSQRAELEDIIKQKQLEEHFQLLGAFDNPYPFMKACDVYVQTSFYEGLGLTLIEAAVLGKAIVTTNFPTAYNVVEDKISGSIVEMKAEEIAFAIENLLTKEELRQQYQTKLALNFKNPSKASLDTFIGLL